MANRATRVVVEYLYGRPGGSMTRTRLGTALTQVSSTPARSETAVLAYLRRRHPGLEITILSLDFQDTTGKSV
jgi:hypothetical protein